MHPTPSPLLKNLQKNFLKEAPTKPCLVVVCPIRPQKAHLPKVLPRLDMAI